MLTYRLEGLLVDPDRGSFSEVLGVDPFAHEDPGVLVIVPVMADGLKVSIESLDAIDKSLLNSRDALGDALRSLNDATAGGLGTAELDQACAEFHDTWQFGLGQLGKCIDVVRAGIEQAKQAYASYEDELTRVCAPVPQGQR